MDVGDWCCFALIAQRRREYDEIVSLEAEGLGWVGGFVVVVGEVGVECCCEVATRALTSRKESAQAHASHAATEPNALVTPLQ